MSDTFVRQDWSDVPVLMVRGKVGVEQYQELFEVLEQLREDARKVAVVDFTDCPFLASRAFPALLKASEDLEGRHKKLLLTCTPELRKVLEVLKLDRLLNIYPDRQAALDAAETLLSL